MKSNADLAREYREKYGAEMPSLKLARLMYGKNKLRFKDLESARAAIRYIEGKMGDKLKKVVSQKEFIKEESRPYNPYNLPGSDETSYTPFEIKGFKRVGILSDIHVPYHNISALTAAIEYLKKQKIDALLLNGDTIDCHRLSRFIKEPKKRDFKGELDCFKALFDVLEKQLKCKIFFKIGNHENRYEHFLMEKAGEIAGIEEFAFENIIKARARGIEIIESNRFMKLNSLNGIHGHEYIGGISAPVNVARGLYLRGKVSAFQGHNHASSEHTETDMDGKVTTTWSIGALCELHPAYMPLNRWNHGCADVDLDSNGVDYEFRNKRIYKGRIL
jgi:predicted phosphodiesterase